MSSPTRKAFLKGKSLFRPGEDPDLLCPYVFDSPLKRSWHSGWNEGEREWLSDEPEADMDDPIVPLIEAVEDLYRLVGCHVNLDTYLKDLKVIRNKLDEAIEYYNTKRRV